VFTKLSLKACELSREPFSDERVKGCESIKELPLNFYDVTKFAMLDHHGSVRWSIGDT
jgi:hypothetical protein